MKKWLLIFLFLPAIGYSQIPITGLNQFIVGGSSGGGGTVIAIDTSYETVVDTSIVNVRYNPLRPNKKIVLTRNLTLFMNNVPIGSTGNVKFTLTTGAETVQLNGIMNTAVPTTPGTFIFSYNNIAGVLNWN